MTKTMKSQSESSGTSTDFESSSAPKLVVVGRYSVASSNSSAEDCLVVELDHWSPSVEAPANHISVAELIRELSADAEMHQEMRAAREWVADQLYPETMSLKGLRLKKGVTQAELAKEIGTSQPYIARMESGQQVSLQLLTMRRICSALGIDMNTLDVICGGGPQPSDAR